MRHRVLFIVALVTVLSVSVGLSASANDHVLTIKNSLGFEVVVRVYNHDDALKWVPCTDKTVKSGSELKVPNNGWPGCGAYDRYSIRAVQVEWIVDSPKETLVFSRDNVARGAYVEMKR